MSKRITFALAGAGDRGQYAYAPYALDHPEEVAFVAVAEPIKERRERFVNGYGVPPENVFETWQNMLAGPPLADALLIATMDNDHVAPALKALEMGYRHILLEKPIDKDLDACRALAAAAKAKGANVQVCHSLRYTRFYRKLKEILDSGRLGRVVNIAHVEGVGYYHQAHSFVRGNWGNAGESSPMILQKCCHDMDLFLYLLGKDCVSVSSFGSLGFFRAENAPEGSAERCVDCALREDCAYSATRIYAPGGHWHTPTLPFKEGYRDLRDMLRHGRLGRCVFHCGNDVVDHQVVNLLFEEGVTVSMTMSAFAHRIGRETRVMCVGGEIYANLEDQTIEIHEFATDNREMITVNCGASGHAGADTLMVEEFARSIAERRPPATDVGISVRSHEMAMLAEEARRRGTVERLPPIIA